MAGSNGNGKTEFKDEMINGIKLIAPNFIDKPLFSNNGSGSNPGVRLISNDDKLSEMLKMLWFPDMEYSRNINEALMECDENLYQPDGTQNSEVLQRIEWIKNLCAGFCSINARFADLYKQTAIGVATTAVTEKGATLLNMPFEKTQVLPERKNNNNNGGKKP